ncbi:GlsB/YeaQ/YmgE family stress response membrane protein [Modestobacter sp. SYSU DS0875]
MDVLWNIIVLIVIGAVAGFIARAVIPGKQSMGLVATIALGIIGSLVGNLLGSLIFDGEFALGTAGWIGSIIGAIVVLGIYVAATSKNRRVTR